MLEPSSYSSRSANQVNTKFGLHDKHFATLPNFDDYHQILEWFGGLEYLINLDIHPEIDNLISTTLDLFVKVPTLGFTDPAYDYDMRPWFAVPVSLNGFGSPVQQPWSSLPKKIIGVDLLGNHYTLLFNEQHQIDYQAIAQENQGAKLLTTLKELIYVYSADQVLAGQGLTPLPNVQMLKNKLILMPPSHAHKDYVLELGLMSEEGVEQSRQVQLDRFPLDDYLHVNNFSLDYDGSSSQLDVFVDAQARTDLALNQYMISLTIPSSGISLQSSKIQDMGVQTIGDQVRINKVFGLSEAALKSVVTHLIPKSNVLNAFESSEPKLDASVFNDFSIPGALDALYHSIIEGVMNTSIPLMALNSMFDTENFSRSLQSMSTENWSIGDNQVLGEFLNHSHQHPQQAAENFADKLDGLLTLDKFYPQLHMTLATQDNFDLDSLEAHLYFEPLDITSQISPIGYIAEKDHFEKVDSSFENASFVDQDLALSLGDETLGRAQTLGKTFSLGPEILLKGADLIHDFSWQNNDTLDLSPLLASLEGGKEAHQVYMQANQQGTEIWVEHIDAYGEVQAQYHVATLSGVSPEEGNLPSSLHSFIEFG